MASSVRRSASALCLELSMRPRRAPRSDGRRGANPSWRATSSAAGWTMTMEGSLIGVPPCDASTAPQYSSASGGARGLTHGLQVRVAALLEQAAHAAVEVLHAETEELRNQVVGAAAAGDAAGLGDRPHPALHHLLDLRVGLLAGVAHG